MMFIVELMAILSIALMACSPVGMACALYIALTKKKNSNAFDATMVSLMMFSVGALGMFFAARIYSTVS